MEEPRVELIKKSLQRLYNEIDREKGTFKTDTYVKYYNDILSESRKIFQENQFIIEQKEIKILSPDISPLGILRSNERLAEVKLNTLKLMDILAVSVETKQEVPHQIINVHQIQNTEQLININIKSLIEAIQSQNIDIELKEAATKAIEDFEEEIKKEKPEPSKIKKCIDSVLKVGKQFAIPLLFKLIENWDKIFKKL